MTELTRAVERATCDGGTLSALLDSTRAVLADCDKRIRAFNQSEQRADKGKLCGFSDEVVHSLSAAITLCRLASDCSQNLIARLDASIEEARSLALRMESVSESYETLLASSVSTRNTMVQMRQSIHECENSVGEAIETLREAVLRNDGAPELRQAVDDLLHRLRKN